jgi:hypothetical protein
MELTAKLATIDDFLAGGCGRAPAVGDVLAFSGSSRVDQFIQDATRSDISHVAILIQPKDGGPLSVLEATGAGVTVTPLAQSLAEYRKDHTCFFLPLAQVAGQAVSPAVLADYYAENANDLYNYAGVAAAGLYDLDNPLFGLLRDHLGHHFDVERLADWLNHVGQRFWEGLYHLDKTYKRLFCSQLVTAALLATRILLPGPPDARLVVPVEVCRFGIYDQVYQLNGDLLAQPFRWGAAPLA